MMSLYDGIQRFLGDVDSTILARGRDYYRRGCVEHLDLEGCFATAEVSGSELYQVEIDFDKDGEVESWDCDCPYDWGPVCKHMVAVMLALQKMPQAGHSPKEKKISVQKLVEQADKEQLVALILEHCKEDKRFKSKVLSELEDSGEQELDAIKEMVRASIRANTHCGYIDGDGCDKIGKDLDDALDKARRRTERGQYGRALEITQYVLLTTMNLVSETESGLYYLDGTIASSLEIVELAACKLAENTDDRGEWVRKLLETAFDPVFDVWTDLRFDFLDEIVVLADTQNEAEFYRALEGASERHRDEITYRSQEKLFRYRLLRAVHGPAEARTYLEQNLDTDGLRLLLIQENREEKDYANAERLCLERIKREKTGHWCRPSQWQHLLYEIYQDWGQREKQIGQARKLALLGDKKFYQTTKELLTQDGRWQEEYPALLEELKAWRPAREYMEILAQEKEFDLLMEQVWVHQDAVFQFGGVLASKYGEEVRRLCVAAIRHAAECVTGRKDYQMLCELIELLTEFGGAVEAQTLICELRQMYHRRPAFLEELEHAERRIAHSVQKS